MATKSRIAVVTGANKGIGLATVRNLALTYASPPLHSGSLTIYLTARSPDLGLAAVKTLHADAALKKAGVLKDDGGEVGIEFRKLDISDPESVSGFGEFVKERYGAEGGIDVLVNNAGIAMDGFDNNVVKTTIKTNYYGTLSMTQTFLPLMREGGRVVNVASTAGVLSKYSPELKKAFVAASQTSVEACSELMEKFTKDVESGNHGAQGWPSAAYAVSKAGEIAMTKAIAMEEGKNKRGVLVNACCPGWVKTDMTKGGGAKTPDEGAKTPVLLALGEFGGTSGGFWKSEGIIEW